MEKTKIKQLISIAILLFSVWFNISAIPRELIGNYYDKSDYLKYSIQNDFFIYKCQFYNYTEVSIYNNCYFITLENTLEKLQLEIIKVDTVHFIFKENDNIFNCVKNKSLISIEGKNYPFSMDSGRVTIRGYISNFKKYYESDSRVEFILSDYVVRNTKSVFADIDSLGKFDMIIQLMHSTSFYLRYRNKLISLFASPHDQLFILLNADSISQMEFMGTHADVCYDIQAIKEAELSIETPEQNNSTFGKLPAEFRNSRRLIRHKKHVLLDTYCIKHNCSEAFKIWYIKDCDNMYYSDLMTYSWMRFDKESDKHLTIQDPYYSFIDSIDLNDNIAPISYNYLFFSMGLYNKFIFRDSIYNPDYYNNIKTKIKENNPNISESNLEIEVQKAIFELNLEKILKTKNSIFKDLRLTILFSDLIDGREFDILDYAFNKIDKEIKYKPYLNIITNYYIDFKVKEEALNKYPVVLNKSLNKAEVILKELFQKNKGKILILDFWFTGCSGCRSDFQKMPAIKKVLKGEDIIFVYLCYYSSETNWNKVIKEFNIQGEHYLLTNDQFSYFSQKFSINSAPRYILINKTGQIVNSNFRPPMIPDLYISELKQDLQR